MEGTNLGKKILWYTELKGVPQAANPDEVTTHPRHQTSLIEHWTPNATIGNLETLIETRFGNSTDYVLYIIEPVECETEDMIDFRSTPIDSEEVRSKSAFWAIKPGGWIEAHRVCKNCKDKWRNRPNDFGTKKPNRGGTGGLSWNVCSRCETALPQIEGTYSCVKIGDCLGTAAQLRQQQQQLPVVRQWGF